MGQSDTAFTGSIPELYDRYLAPLLFQPYADELAARLSGFTGELLEVAGGTGVVTRALDAALPREARIVATDLNPPMLAQAARQGLSARVRQQAADGQALPFEAGAFDAVVCQFGVMFFPDRVAGYREARRVLRPGGVYLLGVWDDLSGNEVTRVVHEALAQLFPENPPAFMARTPHGYADADRIVREVSAGGFAEVSLETLYRIGHAASARDAALGLCQGSPLRGEIEAHGPDALQRATDVATEALRRRYGDGAIEGALRAHLVTAKA